MLLFVLVHQDGSPQAPCPVMDNKHSQLAIYTLKMPYRDRPSHNSLILITIFPNSHHLCFPSVLFIYSALPCLEPFHFLIKPPELQYKAGSSLSVRWIMCSRKNHKVAAFLQQHNSALPSLLCWPASFECIKALSLPQIPHVTWRLLSLLPFHLSDVQSLFRVAGSFDGALTGSQNERNE